jgi:hypothetical protein
VRGLRKIKCRVTFEAEPRYSRQNRDAYSREMVGVAKASWLLRLLETFPTADPGGEANCRKFKHVPVPVPVPVSDAKT